MYKFLKNVHTFSRVFFVEEQKMNSLRNRYNRVIAAAFTGILAAVLFAGIPAQKSGGSVLSWWGTLYPAFCFEEGEEQKTTAGEKRTSDTETASESSQTEKDGSEPEVKISFWLAKVFDRW